LRKKKGEPKSKGRKEGKKGVGTDCFKGHVSPPSVKPELTPTQVWQTTHICLVVVKEYSSHNVFFSSILMLKIDCLTLYYLDYLSLLIWSFTPRMSSAVTCSTFFALQTKLLSHLPDICVRSGCLRLRFSTAVFILSLELFIPISQVAVEFGWRL
jgi:hypothetical protein